MLREAIAEGQDAYEARVATVPPVAIDRGTARKLARAGGTARAAIADRDRVIIQAAANGATLREIADAVGLSPSGVKKVLDRHR